MRVPAKYSSSWALARASTGWSGSRVESSREAVGPSAWLGNHTSTIASPSAMSVSVPIGLSRKAWSGGVFGHDGCNLSCCGDGGMAVRGGSAAADHTWAMA